VTPCNLVEIHPYCGRIYYPQCAFSRFLWNNDFLPDYPISHSTAVFSKVTVLITSCHASPSLFLCSVSIKLLSDLWNLYRVIQEERSVFWEVVVSVIVRQKVCLDMSSCDWLLRWSGRNVQTDSLYGHVQLWLATEMEWLECPDRQFVWTCPIVIGYWDGAVGMSKQFVWTCPIVTGYWDGEVGMSKQTVCMDMSNCDWLLRWSSWNV